MKKRLIAVLFITFLNFIYAGTCPLNQNLVKGGSFENSNDLNEWSIVNGNATPSLQKYSSDWAGDAPSGAGEVFLYAKNNDSVILKQTIDLSSCSFTNEYSYNFSVYLGGYNNYYGDTARVKILFKDSSGETIKSYDTDYQTSTHQMNRFNYKLPWSNNINYADIMIEIKQSRYMDNDIDGYVDLVSLKVMKTEYLNGFQDFEIINSPESRLLRGNFEIAGNTVMCLTDKNDGFGGTCQDESVKYETSNLRFSKYIDIDDNVNTWNSSSSYIELPSSYKNESNGAGIVWAGLFWQGRVSTDSDYPLRYGVSPFNEDNYIRTDGGSFDIENSNANKILIKINNKNYQNIEASKLAYYSFSNGTTYAAYADVTKLLQEAKLKRGKNIFQIANLLTNEGRERSPGVFGGWSLVVIYKEDLSGKVRSINSYFGFRDIYQDTPIKIGGLRLPKNGEVSSKAALFSGEGEYLYGKNDKNSNSSDWIKINNYQFGDYQYMPDANGNPLPSDDSVGNRDNIFDAHLSGVKRDHIDGKYNDLQINNNGVDIDIFDLSSIMQEYRDENSEISTIYLKMLSNNDYVTPSMLTFATELYSPKVCYDYALLDGNYTVISDTNRTFKKDANGQPLKVKVTLRSKETDFDLINSKMHIEFNPNGPSYIPGSAKYTEPNTNAYEDAHEINTQNGLIAVGSNPTDDGGTISTNETIYTIESFDVNEDFNGTFDIVLDATINFDDSTSIDYSLALDRCPTNPTYDPTYWKFNIEKANVDFDTPEAERYSLPTRVVGKPYKVSLASYKKDANGRYTLPNKAFTTVELELINADGFDNNSSAGFDTVCEEPSSIGEGVFVKLNNQNRKVINIPDDYPTYPSNLALKNATFRMWVLTRKINGVTEFINNMCSSAYDNMCFTAVYGSMYKNYDNIHLCLDDCNPESAMFNPNSRQCYDCLKKYFAKPVCARDNFAIRPKSFSVSLSDNNQTNSNSKVAIKNNQESGIADIAAGYLYRLDINATTFDGNFSAFNYNFNTDNYYSKSNLIFNDLPTCNDKSNKEVKVSIFNGTTTEHESLDEASKPKNGLIADNSGKYKFNIEDSGWTIVDQKGYIYKPFKNVDDCIINSASIGSENALNGCNVSSNSQEYKDINISVHPYKLDMNVSIVNNRNHNSNFIYASNLSSTANSLKENVMAMKSDGTIVAKGWNGSTLSNYTDQCSAKPLQILYNFNTTPNVIKNAFGDTLLFEHFSYEPTIDVNVTDINVSNFATHPGITFDKKYFDKNSSGVANFNNFFNIQRTYNRPMNPFKISFNSIDVSSPEQMFVDLNSSYQLKTKQDLNNTITVYYGKAVSPINFYDDVLENSIITPIEYRVYCDANLSYCNDMGIDANYASTDEFDWWVNTGHNYQDGRVTLVTSNPIEANTSTDFAVRDFDYGVDNSISVNAISNNKPYIVKVVPSNDFKNNSPWLLYNKNGNTPPDYLYKVRFIDSVDMWSGLGDSGFSIDVNSTIGKKSKKIDW